MDETAPTTGNTPTARTAQDELSETWRPSDAQRSAAAALIAALDEADCVIVPIALPGKVHGIWTLGQTVEHPNGFWPIAYRSAQYGPARDAAEAAALAALGDRPGQPSYAFIFDTGVWSVFEGSGHNPVVGIICGYCDQEFPSRVELSAHQWEAGEVRPAALPVLSPPLAVLFELARQISRTTNDRKELAELRSSSILSAADGHVDLAMELAVCLFDWATDALRRLILDDSADHLVEALALLFATYRDDDPTDPDTRLVEALEHVREAAEELAASKTTGEPS